MKDKNGKQLQKGDSVRVPDPNDTDIHNHEFVGTVDEFRGECAVIVDGDGDCFCIEPERLEFYDEEKERPSASEVASFLAVVPKEKKN